MFTCGRWDNDWYVWEAKILDEYPNEYAWMICYEGNYGHNCGGIVVDEKGYKLDDG